MTDRELLEKAAKAIDLYVYDWMPDSAGFAHGNSITNRWNPLTDDGDAFRLLLSSKLNLAQGDFSACVSDEDCIDDAAFVPNEEKRAEVVRRLIVEAVAAMGEAK